MIDWLGAFVATCAIELAILRWLGPRRPGATGVALVAQAVTHPLVWIAMATLPGPLLARLVAVELGATLVEAEIYARRLGLAWRDAFGLSALANAGSLLAGAAIGAALAAA